MKPPFSYYGGKQKLASRIIAMMPEHHLYAEPFVGGGAVFWNKPQSKVEIINDTNRELINFYRMVQHDFVSLEKEIMISLHSRDQHRQAKVIYNNPDMFNELKRAWAVWILANQGFASQIDSSWGYDLANPTMARKIKNRREGFTYDYAIRMQEVQIECTDAIRIINSRDRSDAFFYIDPPYYNSDCGHYDGYTIDDFERLLQTLTKIEGKFLLSSYPSPVLKKYTKEHDWQSQSLEQTVSVARKKDGRKVKREVFTGNYELASTSFSRFSE